MSNAALILMFLVLSVFSHAMPLEKTFPYKETLCKVGKEKASLFLRFHEKIDFEQSDFSGSTLVFLKGKTLHEIETLTQPYPGDFVFAVPKLKSACKDTQAFDLDGKHLAIVYAKDNRPFQDLHQLVVWNAQTDKIIEKKELGSITDFLTVKNGFAFSLFIPRSDIDYLDITSPSGKKMSAADKDLNAFQVVSLKDSKVVIEFDPSLSYEKSIWKKFFKNKEEYLKAAGWDSKLKTFKNVVVYEGTYFNRKESNIKESCIALTHQRGASFESPTWRCVKEKF